MAAKPPPKPPSSPSHPVAGANRAAVKPPAAPPLSVQDKVRTDARATSLEAGKALQRILDAAPGAQANKTIDAATQREATRVLEAATKVSVTVPGGEVTAQAVEERVDELRRRLAVQRPVAHDTKTQLGDETMLDLLGYLGGEPFVAHTDTWYTIKPNPLLPGLFESLVDIHVPNQRVVHVTLPDDYPVKVQAGRTAVFAVHIKEAHRRELPDLDDPFVLPLLNRGARTAAELREQVKQELVQERALSMVEHAKLLVLRELYVQFMHDAVPPEAVEEELTRRWRSFVGEALIRQGVSIDEQQRSRQAYGTDDNVRAEARRTVWEMRVCEAIAQHLGVQLTEADLKKALVTIFGPDVEIDNVLYKNPQLHKDLLKGLRMRRAIEALVARAQVSFDGEPTPLNKAYLPLSDGKNKEKPVQAARGLSRAKPPPKR